MKLLLLNFLEAGKSIITLDVEHEQWEMCRAVGGCFADIIEGTYKINLLEPRCWDTDADPYDVDAPSAFRQSTRLAQHISFLKDVLRCYKDFTTAQIDTIEILLMRLYTEWGITEETDFSLMKSEDYEDAAHHNAVFIGTDEGNCPRHAHLRSTNSFGKAFRLNVESSDPRYSFHYNGTDGSLYVFEAPIDMLSYISMNPRQWQKHSYVACCGTSPLPVMQMLKPDTQMVYLCLDNDDAGHKASERMAEQLRERGVMTERLVPELKDWNDDLLHAQKEELHRH